MLRLPTVLLVLMSALLSAVEVSSANTVVVINGASTGSAQVARAWMRLRGVADEQAITLPGVPSDERITVADFRRLILDPLEVELVRRGLAASTLVVAYAPDFPTEISFDDSGLSAGCRSPGSLTGMTLLAPLLDAAPAVFTAPGANPYAEQPVAPGFKEEVRATADPRSARCDQLLTAKDYPAAEILLKQLAHDIPAPGVLYNLACAQALSGGADAALATLGRAIDAGWMHDQHSQQDPDLAALRTHPTWPDLIKRMRVQATSIRPGPSVPFTQEASRGGSPPGRLAILLGNTTGVGLSVDETITNFTHTVAAEAVRPTGTVYFMASSDVARTGPRRWAFAAAAAVLGELGVHAEIIEGNLPPRGAQVIGATLGLETFDWSASGAVMQPGAWCDHLTSFGGVVRVDNGQTSYAALLRAGAAGAGGTVTEPLNHHYKFPSAFVHVHRARGLSLVEAVYRTMSCPYQYLVVGDPLSRPWPHMAH